jgi:hypothetical protein
VQEVYLFEEQVICVYTHTHINYVNFEYHMKKSGQISSNKDMCGQNIGIKFHQIKDQKC